VSTSLRTEIEDYFARFNALWLDRRTEEIRPLLHPDAALAPPGDGPRVRGADAFVASVDAFARAAEVHRYVTLGVEVEAWDDDVAAGWLRYEIEYTAAGDRSRERGIELWILQRERGAWRALLRVVHAPVVDA
jgi:hypothetical protein